MGLIPRRMQTMENSRVIAETTNMVNDIETALNIANDLLYKINGYSSFTYNNNSTDSILYLNESEELNENIEKKLYDALIRCHALTDILKIEVNSFIKK